MPDPRSAVFVGTFSDFAMRSGEWEALGVHPQFDRDQWQFSRVRFRNTGTKQWFAIDLDDRDPLKEVAISPVEQDIAMGLPSGDLFSPSAMERFLR